MFKVFNAFQIVVLFAAMPYLIGWLTGDPFAYSGSAFWVASAVYVVLFFAMVASVTVAMDEFKL